MPKIQRYRRRLARHFVVAAWMAMFPLRPVASRAHEPPPLATRELVRLQGFRTQGQVDGTVREVTIVALAKEQRFAATDFQIFGLGEAATAPSTARRDQAPLRFSLQGRRDQLRRFAEARANQRITILAEHRPGSSDLFLLSLDLCPDR